MQEAQLRFLPKEKLVRYLDKIAEEEKVIDGREGQQAIVRDYERLKALTTEIKGHTDTKLQEYFINKRARELLA